MPAARRYADGTAADLKFQETVRKLLESESYRQSCIRQNLENMPGYDWSVVKKRMQSIYMQMDDS